MYFTQIHTCVYVGVHPSIFFGLSGLKQRGSDLSFPDQFISPLEGSQGVYRRPAEIHRPSGISWISWRHPQQMLVSPHLTHLAGEVAALHTDTHPTPHQMNRLLSLFESSFCRLYPTCRSVSRDTLLVTKDENRNVDRPVIHERRLSGQLLLDQKRHHC